MKDIKDLAHAEGKKVCEELHDTVIDQRVIPNFTENMHESLFVEGFVKGAEFGYNQRWIPVTPKTMPKEKDAYDNCIPVWHRTKGYQVQILSYFLKHPHNFTHWQPIYPPKS